MKTNAEKIAALYRAIGAERDTFGMLWKTADDAARRVLLRVAGRPDAWCTRQWSEIDAAHRAEIKRRAQQMREWLNQFLDGEAAA